MSTAALTVDTPGTAASGRAFTVVRVVLGVLLVTAAGLKLYGLNVTAVPRVGWLATPRVQVAAAAYALSGSTFNWLARETLQRKLREQGIEV